MILPIAGDFKEVVIFANEATGSSICHGLLKTRGRAGQPDLDWKTTAHLVLVSFPRLRYALGSNGDHKAVTPDHCLSFSRHLLGSH